MLRLTASFSKKVPAEGEYTSQQYHASVETELPDALTPDQLRDRIASTFALVRDSVEAELHPGARDPAPPVNGRAPAQTPRVRANQGKISNAQARFALDIAKRQGLGLSGLNEMVNERFGVDSLYDLDRKSASALLDELNDQRKAA